MRLTLYQYYSKSWAVPAIHAVSVNPFTKASNNGGEARGGRATSGHQVATESLMTSLFRVSSLCQIKSPLKTFSLWLILWFVIDSKIRYFSHKVIQNEGAV